MAMQRARELWIGDRLLRLIEAGPPPATEPAVGLRADVYTCPDRHRRELRAMAAHPAAAVTSTEVAEPGDFATMRLGGVPIIVARDRHGQVHAMHNVCAHRGSTLEPRAQGSARVLSCGFHGWSYDLDGSLRAVSDAKLFSSSPCERGLRQLACEERHGIVWVTADADAAVLGVRDWLGTDLDDLVTDLQIGDMVCHVSTELRLDCNWKLLTDGFLELYHLKYLHRNSIAPYFPANLVDFERCGDHVVTLLPKNRLVKQLTERPRDEWDVFEHLSMPIVLTPGTVLQWQAGHVELFSFRPDPDDPARTVCRLSLLVPADRAGDTELWDRNWERVCDTIPGEDFAKAVEIQRNIDAGVVPELQIGANERFICEHLAAVDRQIARHRSHADRARRATAPTT